MPGLGTVRHQHNFNAPFENQLCEEDLIRTNMILSLDIQSLHNSRLQQLLYQGMLKPVQTGCQKMRRIGNYMHIF